MAKNKKISKFTNFIESIKIHREINVCNTFKGGMEIFSEWEEVLSLNWNIPNLKSIKPEFEKYKYKISPATLLHIYKECSYPRQLPTTIWKKLQNSSSFSVKSMEHAEEKLKLQNLNLEDILEEYQINESMAAAVVIKWEDGSYELVCGDAGLMIARANKIVPDVIIIQID